MAAKGTIAEPRFVGERPASIRDAFDFARDAHDGEERKGDGAPFIVHPVAVAALLDAEGYDDAVLTAALLHDVVENTDHELDELVERFGVDVAELVAAMTEDESIEDYEQRKDAHREQIAAAGERAAAIYVADKLSNLRDMRRLYADVGERAGERFKAPTLDDRVTAWRRDTAMGARMVPGLALTRELRGELDAFEAERAVRRGTVSSGG